MTRTLRTNEAYAYLAYRKAILQHTIAFLQNRVIGTGGDDDTEKIISEDVFHCDAEVPVEEVHQYVDELKQKKSVLELEMAKFEFSRKDDGKEQEAKAKRGNDKAPGRKAGRQGKQPKSSN